jgi:uncharacterized protein YndB with AHSA1/START domain
MKFIDNSILIHASANRIWNVLTQPEETKKYMFGCETVSDWKVGSSLLWRGVHEGQEMVFVKGSVLAIEPNKKLVYTTFDPFSSIIDIPKNYLIVTYKLDELPEGTLLRVTQGDYDEVADGARRYAESWNNGTGWSPILEEIKKVAEAK